MTGVIPNILLPGPEDGEGGLVGAAADIPSSYAAANDGGSHAIAAAGTKSAASLGRWSGLVAVYVERDSV